MSTHNIGFYEDLTKFIFELSANIIKYAPYFFCCRALTSHYRKWGLLLSGQRTLLFTYIRLKASFDTAHIKATYQLVYDLMTRPIYECMK